MRLMKMQRLRRIKVFHDKLIMRKAFIPGQKILLYDFRLHLFSGKLKSLWTRPFVVRIVLPHRAVEICDTKNGNEFKVNGQYLKPFLESAPDEETTMGLFDPIGNKHHLFLHFISCTHAFIHTLRIMHEIGVGEGLTCNI